MLLSGHRQTDTHRTDYSIRTTKVVGKNLDFVCTSITLMYFITTAHGSLRIYRSSLKSKVFAKLRWSHRLPALTLRRHLHSAINRHLLAVPRFALNTFGRRAFSVAGGLELSPEFYPGLSRILCGAILSGSVPNNQCRLFQTCTKTYLFARY